MSEVKYSITQDSGSLGVSNVMAFFPDRSNPLVQADSNHPHWNEIVNGLRNGEDVYDLFSVGTGLFRKLEKLSDRISYDGKEILFDGKVQDSALSQHVIRCLQEKTQDYAPVVKFWEKVADNPDDRSREQLFSWLKSHQFTITSEGDILGYKGVRRRGQTFVSIASGTAMVDGVEITGNIPNNIGTEVSMYRSMVENDPNVACHVGLHVGDWSYASGFADGAILEVHVNPRDVVSIPRDSSYRKMRTCKYKVVGIRVNPSPTAIEIAGKEEKKEYLGYSSY